ncbi:MAG: ribonuclease R [Proteobacteria bacterium]|nr:ribonuclease R [Pseudomonadota bacterium]
MTKKRTPRRRSGQSRAGRHRRSTPENGQTQNLLVDRILGFLAGRPEPATTAMILAGLDLPGQDKKTVMEILADLEKAGKVTRQHKKYLLADGGGLIRATLDLTGKGFGFALVEGADKKDKDPFIAPFNLNGASHGDRILIRLIGTGRGRPEARVVKILKRGISRLCGIYTAGGKTGYVTPDNERLPYTVHVHRDNSLGARDNTAVLLEIIDYGSANRPPEGKIIEILGDPFSVAVQLRMTLEQFELPRSFPEDVEQEVRRLRPLVKCDTERTDLRHIPHVTIDGETAKDFDDAIAVEQTKTGFRLHVSIADVSHYVRTDSAIDIEAYRRGTSTYLPDLVIPMLPERLSNDLCSLVPDQDRPAFTAILEFDKKGHRTGQRYCKSMIRSHRRFTYTAVRQILYDRDPAMQESHRDLLPMLEAAGKLAQQLQQRRRQRGSIGFNIPEAEIRLQGDKIDTIARAERNQAHQLVEECMLAANEAVAETLANANQDVLYRIHERPDPDKVDLFTETASVMGLQLPKTEISPAWFARVVEEANESPVQYVVNNLMLRTMQQARYSPENLGHFGLAAEYYLHFTSPIRRYPDLVAHRVLLNFLTKAGKNTKKTPVLPNKTVLPDAALHLSTRERLAIGVERNARARLGALFLKDRIGEEFEAIISGVTSFGLFIELLETFISGAVPVQEMRDDYYVHDARGHRLVGEHTGTTHQMGDLVRVRLNRVDMLAKRLTFSLVEKHH